MVPSNIRAETGLYAITPTLLYLVTMEWIMWKSTRYQNNGIRWKIESTLDVLEYANNIMSYLSTHQHVENNQTPQNI